jgi:hypothetical protein
MILAFIVDITAFKASSLHITDPQWASQLKVVASAAEAVQMAQSGFLVWAVGAGLSEVLMRWW